MIAGYSNNSPFKRFFLFLNNEFEKMIKPHILDFPSCRINSGVTPSHVRICVCLLLVVKWVRMHLKYSHPSLFAVFENSYTENLPFWWDMRSFASLYSNNFLDHCLRQITRETCSTLGMTNSRMQDHMLHVLMPVLGYSNHRSKNKFQRSPIQFRINWNIAYCIEFVIFENIYRGKMVTLNTGTLMVENGNIVVGTSNLF